MGHPAWGGSPDTVGLATAYTAGIIRDHTFVDGNKRTGFILGAPFLEMNGYRLTASEEDATQAVLGLAGGTLDETAFAVWMRANVKPESGPEVDSLSEIAEKPPARSSQMLRP